MTKKAVDGSMLINVDHPRKKQRIEQPKHKKDKHD